MDLPLYLLGQTSFGSVLIPKGPSTNTYCHQNYSISHKHPDAKNHPPSACSQTQAAWSYRPVEYRRPCPFCCVPRIASSLWPLPCASWPRAQHPQDHLAFSSSKQICTALSRLSDSGCPFWQRSARPYCVSQRDTNRSTYIQL